MALAESGADGLLPMKRLPEDFYDIDEHRHSLAGRATGLTFKIGDTLLVKLVDADSLTGGVLLDYVSGGTTGTAAGRRSTGKQGKKLKSRSKQSKRNGGTSKGRGKKPR